MENDYISREAAIKDLLSDTVIADDLFGMGALHERDRVIAKINDFPAADVRPVVHGRVKMPFACWASELEEA